MAFYSLLSAASWWMTYLVRIALGYIVAASLSALIQNPRVRARLWGCFLSWAVVGWLVLLAPTPAGRAAAPGPVAAIDPGSLALHWSVPVDGAWAPQLGWMGTWAIRFYLSILIFSLFQLLVKRVQLESLLRNTRQASAEQRVLFNTLCGEMRVSQCQLRLVPGLRSPATACWRRPQVLLPVELVPRLDRSQLTNVLRHELMHVKRGDYLWDRLAALACRLVFFHPAVWLAHRRLRWERELVCDLVVVGQGGDTRLQYAQCLTRLARFLSEGNSGGGIGFSSSASLLATRVRALLREPSPLSVFQQAWRGSLVALVVMIGCCVLPRMAWTLYWSAPVLRPQSVNPVSARKGAASKRLRAPSQSGVNARVATMPAPPEGPNQLTDIFADLSSATLPVLANPPLPRSHGEAMSSSAASVVDKTGSPASHSVWDETPAPSTQAAAPSWVDVANRAIRVGVAIAQDRINSRNGPSEGEQPGHLQ